MAFFGQELPIPPLELQDDARGGGEKQKTRAGGAAAEAVGGGVACQVKRVSWITATFISKT